MNKKGLCYLLALLMTLACVLTPKEEANAASRASIPNTVSFSNQTTVKVNTDTYDALDKAVGCTDSIYAYAVQLRSKQGGECQAVALSNLIRRWFAKEGIAIEQEDFKYFSQYIFWNSVSLGKTKIIESIKNTGWTVSGDSAKYVTIDADIYSGLSDGQIFTFGDYNFKIKQTATSDKSKLKTAVDNAGDIGVIARYSNSYGHWMVIKKDGNGDLSTIGPDKASYRMRKLSAETDYTSLQYIVEISKVSETSSKITFGDFMNAINVDIKSAALGGSMTCPTTPPKAGSISINMTNVPNNHEYGSSIWLEGTITATDCTLTGIVCKVYDSNNKLVDSWTAPNVSGNKYVIGKNAHPDGLAFRSCAVGNYKLVITATGSNCAPKDYVKEFSVVKTPSGKITMTSAPTTITKGNSFYLKGTISSKNCSKMVIKGSISGTNQSYSYTTTSSSISISTNNIDKFAFRNLPRGKYTLTITVENESQILLDKFTRDFTVK